MSSQTAAYGFSDGIFSYSILSNAKKTVEVSWAAPTYYSLYDDQECYYEEYTIAENVTYEGQTYSVEAIGAWSFSGLANHIYYDSNEILNYAKRVLLPESVKVIGSGAFSFCFELEEINFPESLVEIEQEAFMHCYRLSSVALPASLKSIGENAFYSSSLDVIYCKMPEPIECNPGFSTTLMRHGILYVPKGKKEAYSKVYPWSEFWDIREMDFDAAIDDLSSDHDNMSVTASNGRIVISGLGGDALAKVYNMQGALVTETAERVIDCLSPDLYIVSVGGKTFKVMLK